MVDAVILMQGARVQSLIGEMRSHKWYSKKIKISDTWVPPQRLPLGCGQALGFANRHPAPTPANSLVQLRVRRVVTGWP